VSGRILAIDTSGTRALVALGEPDGSPITERRWFAGYRHGEELLSRIDEMLTDAGCPIATLSGIVVGTGPGAFTGLRVGLATAKALARGLGIPIAGVATSEALLAAGLAGGFDGNPGGSPAAGRPFRQGRRRPVARLRLVRGGDEAQMESGTDRGRGRPARIAPVRRRSPSARRPRHRLAPRMLGLGAAGWPPAATTWLGSCPST
jgi:tRNA threonylcarbamoyl adenosine modification protein YeaZ